MRRLLAGVLVALAALAVVLVPAPPAAEVDVTFRPVTSATLVCPELAVTADSAAVAGSLVAPDLAGDGGSAALEMLGSDDPLARIAAPAAPVHLLMSGSSQPPVITRAIGGWAPAALSGFAMRGLDGAAAGLSSGSCPVPRATWWFVGPGSQVGRSSVLLVVNPSQEPARIDLTLYGRSGPVPALAGKGVVVGAEGVVRIRLAALAADQPVLGVSLQATGGRVAVALRDVEAAVGGRARGVDFVPAAQPPAGDLLLPGVPGGSGTRDLVLVNPTDRFATVTPQLLTTGGTVDLPGLATLAVPAGSAVTVPLATALDGRAGTLHLTSDTAITGALRSQWGSATRDTSWTAATPPTSSDLPLAGAAVVAAGPGLRTTVTIAAPTTQVVGTLVYSGSGGPDEAVLAGDGGPLADGDLGGGGTELLVPGTRVGGRRVDVTVPAGAQQEIALDGLDGAAVAWATWQAAEGSGPASVGHLSIDASAPLASGFPWWPTTSAVRTVPVTADVGTLLGTGP